MLDYTQLKPPAKRIEFPSDMTAEEFLEYCIAYKHLGVRIERNPNGSVVMEPPLHFDSGYLESRVFYFLNSWHENQDTISGLVTGASAGFLLENGAVRSPDASWISDKRLSEVAKADLKKFLPKCPEFIVEVRSRTDSLKKTQAKMKEWIANGALLAWLIDPPQEKAWIYRANGTVEEVDGFAHTLSGEEVLPGFTFDLRLLRFPG